MTESRIFQVFSSAEAFWEEAYRLMAHIPDAFAAADISVKTYKSEESVEGDNAFSRTGFHFEVHNAVGGQRKPSQFLLMLDLWRPEVVTTWPHAKQALLTFAYEPRFDDGWEAYQIVVDPKGQIEDEETRQACTTHAEGRLIEWKYGQRQWQQRAWLFSTPLEKLDGPISFDREIVMPVASLLKRKKQPVEALIGTSAITFAQV